DPVTEAHAFGVRFSVFWARALTKVRVQSCLGGVRSGVFGSARLWSSRSAHEPSSNGNSKPARHAVIATTPGRACTAHAELRGEAPEGTHNTPRQHQRKFQRADALGQSWSRPDRCWPATAGVCMWGL